MVSPKHIDTTATKWTWEGVHARVHVHVCVCMTVVKGSWGREGREGMGRTLKVLEQAEWGESDLNIVIMSKGLKKCF